MPEYIEIPLNLCQVLEEEAENLPPPTNSGRVRADEDGAAVVIPPADATEDVTVNQDWIFDEGHADATLLALTLTHAYEDWFSNHKDAPSDAELQAEQDLSIFLAFRYPGLWRHVSPPVSPNTDTVELLNRILRDEDASGVPNSAAWTVYKRERFERLVKEMREETSALMALGWEEKKDGKEGEVAFEGAEWVQKDKPRFARSDLARFRRLLLEDAFPSFPSPTIRRIYDLRLGRAVRVAHQAGRSAICLSGGGIRSGTFALGIIQSLAKRGLLKQFDYLSTVSGGGYIGGWLTAWIHRHPRGLDGVVDDLNGETRTSKLEPEPEPLEHLRDYSSFITPKTGVLSADTWTFIVIYIRNLLLNWVVLIPLMASVLMIPRVATAVVLAPPGWRVLAGLLVLGGIGVLLLKPDWNTFKSLLLLGVPSMLIILWGWSSSMSDPARRAPLVEGTLLLAGTLLGGYAMAYMRVSRPSNTGAIRAGSFWDKHRDQSSFLWLCLLPLTISATLLTTFWAWFRHTAGVSSERTVTAVHFLGFEQVINFLGLGGVFHSLGRAFIKVAQLIGLEKVASSILNFEMGEFTGFLLFGFLLGLTGWLLYVVLAIQSWSGTREELQEMYKNKQGRGKRLTGILLNALRDFVVTILSNLLGAVLLYVAAVKISIFYDPVIEPFTEVAYKNGMRMELLPYANWFYAELYTCLALPVYLFIFFLGITLFVGFTSRRFERSPRERRKKNMDGIIQKVLNWVPNPFDLAYVEDEDREWLARASAWVFIVIGGWAFFGGLVIFGPLLYMALGNWLAGLGGLSGLASVIGGRSARTPGNKKEEAQGGLLQTLGVNLLVIAAFIFFTCIVLTVSLLSGTIVAWLAQFFTLPVDWYLLMSPQTVAIFSEHYPFQNPENVFRVTHFPSWLYLLGLALGLQLFGRLFARLINLNKFSLHAGYRDRIIRAFLGASRLRGERRANPFTGFDPRDNLHMQELRPGLLRESDFVMPDGLTRFVKELNRPAAELERRANASAKIAKFLRDEIEAMEGESRRFFKDPPVNIELNPSFRSALFGDLNSILQDEIIPPATATMSPPQETENTDGAARIKENRRRLNEAFDYIEDPPRDYRLLHLVNMTLNLVGGDRLAWQQRRAESFTASPLHSGSLFVGYRRTRDYGGKNGISLGTAVAASGAAASSNMGYFSPSVFVTFVLTFFNARLGWWLGNPGVHGADTFYRSHPQSALSPILDEAFGLTNDENPYILLSDGGHFENLGLYEMILRRCRHIIVVDGSADPSGSYDDLGGAVRKIRIDFGIPIEFSSPFPIISRPESEKGKGNYFAVGDIHYEAVDDPNDLQGYDHTTADGKHERRNRLTGKLVYIKPAIYDKEPRDIFNYAKGDPTFPHESTADQFFDEPQFESHRMLGFHILEDLIRHDDRVVHSPDVDNIDEFVSLLVTKAEAKAGEKAKEQKKQDEKHDK